MKFLRLLEVLSASLFFVSVIINGCLIVIPFSRKLAVVKDDPSLAYDWTSNDIFIWLIVYFLVPVFAVLHAYLRSNVALLLLSMISVLPPFAIFVLTPFGGSVWLDPLWATLLPGFLGISTIFFAGATSIGYLQHDQWQSKG